MDTGRTGQGQKEEKGPNLHIDTYTERRGQRV